MVEGVGKWREGWGCHCTLLNSRVCLEDLWLDHGSELRALCGGVC